MKDFQNEDISLREAYTRLTQLESNVVSLHNEIYQMAPPISLDDANYDYTGVKGYDSENHKVVRTVTLTVNKADSTAATVTPVNRTYDGMESSLATVTGDAVGGVMNYALGENGTTAPTEGWSTSIPTATDAGTYYVWYKVVGDGNHNDLVATTPVTAEIAKAAINITADDKSTQYGADIAELTYKVSGAYVTGDDLGVTVSTTATNASPVNTYPISISWNNNANYTATLTNGTYTITKADLTVSASGYSGTYDRQAHGISVDVGNSGATVYYGTAELTEQNYSNAGSTTNPTYTDAGTYTVRVRVTNSDKYEDATATDTFTIAKREVTLKWSDKTFTEDGEFHVPTATVGNLVEKDTCTATVSGEQAEPGTYIATVTKLSNANYKLPANASVTFEIVAKPTEAPTAR